MLNQLQWGAFISLLCSALYCVIPSWRGADLLSGQTRWIELAPKSKLGCAIVRKEIP